MVQGEETAIALIVQVGVSGALAAASIFLHGAGLLATSRLLGLNMDRLSEQKLGLGSLALVTATGFCLFLLHSFEIGLFAGFYLLVGAVASLEEALFHSAAAYATLGTLGEILPEQWRLVTACEALVGFILIGWSTAFVVRIMNRLSD